MPDTILSSEGSPLPVFGKIPTRLSWPLSKNHEPTPLRIGIAKTLEYYKLGNVLDEEVVNIYNNKIFSDYRKAWLTGKVNELKYCNDCSIVNSYFHKSYKTEN